MRTEGIRHITADDIQAARELGYVIKHIASAEVADDSIALQVRPVLLPATHQLASVRDENNAVLVRGDAVGEMLFSGKGAGSLPSASAVLSDIVDIACHKGGFSASFGGAVRTAVPDHPVRHYLRFPVSDPSAIGPITNILERNGVGIVRAAAVWAKNASAQNQVRVLTHACCRSAVETSQRDIAASGLEKGKSIALRVVE